MYCVFRNSDMTEGRGPMVLDKLFDDLDQAHYYVMGRTGVMGSAQNQSQTLESTQKEMVAGWKVKYNSWHIEVIVPENKDYKSEYLEEQAAVVEETIEEFEPFLTTMVNQMLGRGMTMEQVTDLLIKASPTS